MSESLYWLIHQARYANTYYLKAKRAGFTMAAAEYLADRKEYMRKARMLKPKGSLNDV